MKLTKKKLAHVAAKVTAKNIKSLANESASNLMVVFVSLVDRAVVEHLKEELFKNGREEIEISREEFADVGSNIAKMVTLKNAEDEDSDRAMGNVVEILQTIASVCEMEQALFDEHDKDGEEDD